MAPVKNPAFGRVCGSFKLLFQVVKFLPATLDKAVIIVMHRKKNFASEIEKLFAENSRILLKEINDKDKIVPGTVCYSSCQLSYVN